MEIVEKRKKPVEHPGLRKLKIETHIRGAGYDAKKVPYIRLCGEWLKNCGFPLEGRVTVSTAHQQLIIRVEN
jgi:hypothetical protein